MTRPEAILPLSEKSNLSKRAPVGAAAAACALLLSGCTPEAPDPKDSLFTGFAISSDQNHPGAFQATRCFTTNHGSVIHVTGWNRSIVNGKTQVDVLPTAEDLAKAARGGRLYTFQAALGDGTVKCVERFGDNPQSWVIAQDGKRLLRPGDVFKYSQDNDTFTVEARAEGFVNTPALPGVPLFKVAEPSDAPSAS